MKRGGRGGGSTLTGLRNEEKKSFPALLRSIPGYDVRTVSGRAGLGVYYQRKLVARCFKKNEFYRFLDESRIDWRKIVSRRLLPDDALYVLLTDTLFIFEVKYQEVAGSVDEKLQTCDFKRKQYIKLVTPLGLKVEYIYVLNEWFSKPEYKDVLKYIRSVNCDYVFDELPLSKLGLPTQGALRFF